MGNLEKAIMAAFAVCFITLMGIAIIKTLASIQYEIEKARHQIEYPEED